MDSEHLYALQDTWSRWHPPICLQKGLDITIKYLTNVFSGSLAMGQHTYTMERCKSGSYT